MFGNANVNVDQITNADTEEVHQPPTREELIEMLNQYSDAIIEKNNQLVACQQELANCQQELVKCKNSSGLYRNFLTMNGIDLKSGKKQGGRKKRKKRKKRTKKKALRRKRKTRRKNP